MLVGRITLLTAVLAGLGSAVSAGGFQVHDARRLSKHPKPVARQATQNCTTIRQRQEWRTLTTAQKTAYISAVKCLATKPSQLNQVDGGHLYDDYTYVHADQRENAHMKPAFFPWHRWFLHLYETGLTQACGYTGPIVYWDWTQDWKNLAKAPVWSSDSTSGLGTNGNPNQGNVVTDGAFAGFTVYYDSQHQLQRQFSTQVNSRAVSPSEIAALNQDTTYDMFHQGVENNPHNFVHNWVAGDMEYIPLSPNDPIFFLHHANIDRLWAKWQDASPNARIKTQSTAYGGMISAFQQAQASDTISFDGLYGNDVTVAQVLDTRAYPLCYQYAS